MFQCRTRDYVCWDSELYIIQDMCSCFNAARSIMCVGTPCITTTTSPLISFKAARGIMCVGTRRRSTFVVRRGCFNAARSMMCVGTLSSPALVPHGLRRCFGKSSVFRAVFAVKMRFPDERSHGRSSLFLVWRGLRRFGKTQWRNVVCASLWIIFHFASITKQYLFYHLCVASSRTTARFTAPRSVAPRPHPVSPSWSRCA